MSKQAFDILQHLKVVEYVGQQAEITCYRAQDVRIRIQVYELYDTPKGLEEDDDMCQAEVTPMPHLQFDGVWDE